MNKTIFQRTLALALCLFLALGLPASGTAADVTGGWELIADDTAEDGAEALSAFEQAATGLMGVEYEPVAVLGKQVVAGMNYCILCRARVVAPDAPYYFALVYVYRDPQGGAEIVNVEVLENTGAAGAVPGGWIANEGAVSLENNPDARYAFKEAMENFAGAKYEPVAVLSRQVVSGTNYCLLALVTPVAPDVRPVLAQVYVYEDLRGGARVTEVTRLSLSVWPEPEEAKKLPVLAVWTREDNGAVVREEYYDENGNLIKTIAFSEQDENGREITIYLYDEEGRLAATEGRSWGHSRERYEYDGYGNLTAVYTVEEDGREELWTSYENEVDERGRLIRQTVGRTGPGNAAPGLLTVFTYDEKDRLLTRELMDPNGNPGDAPFLCIEYVYDASGRQTEVHSYLDGEEAEYTLREFNDDGFVIRETRGMPELCEETCLIEYYYDNPYGLDAWLGSFYTPNDAPADAELEIRADGSFTLSILRLTVIEGEASLREAEIVLLRGTDANGGPIELELQQEENGFLLTVTVSDWALLPDGTEFPMAR